MRYSCKDGDRLDSICLRQYGTLKGTVEAVLIANPHLAELPPVLTSGTVIELPNRVEPTQEKTTVRLWD